MNGATVAVTTVTMVIAVVNAVAVAATRNVTSLLAHARVTVHLAGLATTAIKVGQRDMIQQQVEFVELCLRRVQNAYNKFQ